MQPTPAGKFASDCHSHPLKPDGESCTWCGKQSDTISLHLYDIVSLYPTPSASSPTSKRDNVPTAITIDQPQASLIALGVKTIETRASNTKYRGRLIIHAGSRCKIGKIGEYSVEDDTPQKSPKQYLLHGPLARPYPLPLQSIIATCELIDVIPMVTDAQEAPKTPVILNLASKQFLRNGGHGPKWSTLETQTRNDHLPTQYPYGDYSPGQYAWILENIKPTTIRCPACWNSGSYPHPLRQVCRVCHGKLSRSPIQAKGQRGIWEWRP